MKTKVLKTEIDEAAAIIRAGGLVAVPTETVYGLACNALDPAAVERVYEVKGRPEIKPLSLMVHDASEMKEYGVDIPPAAYTLAERFWPGPLTMVLRAKNSVPEIVRAGGDTIGLRCPDHPLTLELLMEAKLPFAAPSANPSGKPSPKAAEEVMAYFEGKIEAVLDGGVCDIGTESSLVDLTSTPYSVLRLGALNETEIFSPLVDAMTVIGITGGTGSGKTTASKVLSGMGALVIDCDEVYHSLLNKSRPLLSELEENFPSAFRAGELNRKELGRIVFSDSAKLLKLNELSHKYVGAEVDGLLLDWAKNGGQVAGIDAIALIEAGIGKRCRAVVGIITATEQRVERLMAREGLSEEYVRLRIAAQKSNEFFKENCDYTVCNDGTTEAFIQKCESLFTEIMQNK